MEPTLFNCKWCNNSYSTSYNLTKHLNSAQKCAKIRGLKIENMFECVGCHHKFTQKTNLTVHSKTCSKIPKNPEIDKQDNYVESDVKSNVMQPSWIAITKPLTEAFSLKMELLLTQNDEKISRLELQITKYEQQLQEINADKLKSKNRLKTLVLTCIRPLTIPYVKEWIEKYLNHLAFSDLYPGLVRVFKKMMSIEIDEEAYEQNYAIGDSSRYNFYRLVGYDGFENPIWKKDPDGSFIDKIFDLMMDKAQYYRENMYKKDIMETSVDNRIMSLRQIFEGKDKESTEIMRSIVNKGSLERKELFLRLRRNLKNYLIV
jgi:hypothetical protein